MTDLTTAVAWSDAVSAPLRTLLCDAQTSGGLLLAVPSDRLDALVTALHARATTAAVIGQVVEGTPGTIEVGA